MDNIDLIRIVAAFFLGFLVALALVYIAFRWY